MRQPENKFKAEVNSTFTFEVLASDADRLDIHAREGQVHVLDGHHAYEVFVKEIDINQNRVVLHIDGRPYAVQVFDALDQLLDELGFNDETEDVESSIHSPMPGLVLSVHVKAGDKVEAGSPLLILEAMKMENVIQAPANAMVEKVHVVPSESVSKGALLVSLSTWNED